MGNAGRVTTQLANPPSTRLIETTPAWEPKSISSASTRHPRLEALTTVRFFASVYVVLFHLKVTGILAGGPWWYRNFAGIGYVGVNFFFVLSGFILVLTYAGPPLNIRQFWRARFARIYPAYVVSLIAAAPFFFFAVRHLELPFFTWSHKHLPTACVLTVTLLQAWIPQAGLTWNSVCWSLSVEAFFYLVFPLLLARSRNLSQSKLITWIFVCWFISLSFSFTYVHLHPDGLAAINSGATNLFWKNLLSFNPLVRLPEFVIGIMTGRLYLLAKRAYRFPSTLVAIGLGALATVIVFANKIPTPVISTGLLSLAFAAIIYGLALRPPWARFLAIPQLVLLGDSSYSLYLLHSTVIARAFAAMPYLGFSIRVAASLAAAIGASLLCYLWLEEPARRLLRPRRTSNVSLLVFHPSQRAS